MREIKFKGKSIESKKNLWIVGDLVHMYGRLWIRDQFNDYHEIYPDSAGQYIGFKDKEGRDIYEGDQFLPGWNYGCDSAEPVVFKEDKGTWYIGDYAISHYFITDFTLLPNKQPLIILDGEIVGNINNIYIEEI